VTSEQIERSRSALTAGKTRKALNLAWKATHRAVRREDRPTVEAALGIAESVAAIADGKLSRQAQQLATFCSACLNSSTGRLSTPTALGRLLERDKKTNDPAPPPTIPPGDDTA